LIAWGGDHNSKIGAAKDVRRGLLKYDFIPQLRRFPMYGNVLAGSAPGPEPKNKVAGQDTIVNTRLSID